MRKYYQKLDKLKPGKFKPLPGKPGSEEAARQMIRNLWSMFSKKPSDKKLAAMTDRQKDKTFGCSVMDYAWTKDVQKAFFSHPYHKRTYAAMKKGVRAPYGMWALQCAPVCIDKDTGEVVVE